MESTLDPVLGAVLPVFGLVACGYLAGRFHIVTQASSQALNQFVYAFALPAMLFIAVYRGSLDEILSGAFLVAVIGATFGTALVGFFLSRYLNQRDTGGEHDACPQRVVREYGLPRHTARQRRLR